jgi:hypothetical protein
MRTKEHEPSAARPELASFGATEAHPSIRHGWRRPGSSLVHVDVAAVLDELGAMGVVGARIGTADRR